MVSNLVQPNHPILDPNRKKISLAKTKIARENAAARTEEDERNMEMIVNIPQLPKKIEVEEGGKISGHMKGSWAIVIRNLEKLSLNNEIPLRDRKFFYFFLQIKLIFSQATIAGMRYLHQRGIRP